MRRQAFTVIELLVVLAIIAILAALSVSITMRVVESQRQANTETSIRTVMKVVEQHWSLVVQKAQKEPISQLTHPAVFFLAGGDSVRAQVIWVKVRLMEAFPATFREVYQPYRARVNKAFVDLWGPLVYISPADSTVPINPAIPGQINTLPWGAYGPLIPQKEGRYMATFAGAWNTLQGVNPTFKGQVKSASPTGTPNPDETCALLFMSLSLKKEGAHPLEADTVGKSAVQERTISNVTYSCLGDSWGSTLMFYRFPALNAELNSLAKPPAPDRLDPQRKLLNNGWYTTPAFPPAKTPTLGQIYETYFHSLNSLNGSFIVPTLVSAGGDRKFDSVSPPANTLFFTNAAGEANDNIFSFRLLLGAGTQ